MCLCYCALLRVPHTQLQRMGRTGPAAGERESDSSACVDSRSRAESSPISTPTPHDSLGAQTGSGAQMRNDLNGIQPQAHTQEFHNHH